MNIVIAIQKLEKQKQDIDAALRVLRSFTETTATADKIKKKLHWTQRPENRKKMMKNLRKTLKGKN